MERWEIKREVLISSSLVTSGGTHGNRPKLCPGRFKLDLRKHFFIKRVSSGWTLEQASWTGGRCLKPVSVEEALDNALDNVL